MNFERARESTLPAAVWARDRQAEFGSVTFLRPAAEVLRQVEIELGPQVEHRPAEYMRFQFRQRQRVRWAANVLPSGALRALCAVRAGLVLRIRACP